MQFIFTLQKKTDIYLNSEKEIVRKIFHELSRDQSFLGATRNLNIEWNRLQEERRTANLIFHFSYPDTLEQWYGASFSFATKQNIIAAWNLEETSQTSAIKKDLLRGVLIRKSIYK